MSNKQYARPGVVNNEVNKYAHVGLFNPFDSGVNVIIDTIYVSKVVGYHVLGWSGNPFDNATFSESRGLAIFQNENGDPDQLNYSKAHVRTHNGAQIDAGQWFNFYGTNTPGVIKERIVLAPGVSCVIRAANPNDQLHANFVWHEEDI